jgi:ribosomal protein L39E
MPAWSVQRTGRRSLYHNAKRTMPSVKLWNGAGTNHARIADGAPVCVRSRPHLACPSIAPTRSRIAPKPDRRNWRSNLNKRPPRSRAVYQSAPPLDLPPHRPARVILYHNVTARRRPIKLWNESGTNRARIADSKRMRVRSRRYLASARSAATRSGIEVPIHWTFQVPIINAAADSQYRAESRPSFARCGTIAIWRRS